MASSTATTLTKDVWTKVLTNVTNTGSVHILEQDEDPTSYLVALVNTGDPAPAIDFNGGIKFDESFSPANLTASDYYVMPKDYDGLVEILI